MYIHFRDRCKTCPACLGRGVIIVHDNPNKAHAEQCPVCGGTGKVRVKECDPYQPYEPWYPTHPTPYYKIICDDNTTAGNPRRWDTQVISYR